MGACGSSNLTPEQKKQLREENIRSKWLHEQLQQEQKSDRDKIKLLFLGAGESGKSTLLKQMIILHGKGFSDEDKKYYLPLCHTNILQSMKTLCKRSMEFSERDPKYAVRSELEAARLHISELKYNDVMTDELARHIALLWKDKGIQATYEERSTFQLNDSTNYFLDKLSAIIQPNYLPTDQDILRARIRTTGIVEHDFVIDQNEFRMVDVGGQRNARRKWIHCFEKVTAVIFVAAISEYDQTLYEDPNINRLHEALNLFEDICRSKWFQHTSMILFLNKKDLFKEKIYRVPLKKCFTEYTGPQDYRSGCKFVKAQFKERFQQPGRRLYTHFTCATDTSNIQRVFNAVRSIIVRNHLFEMGLLAPDDNDFGAMEEEEEDEPNTSEYDA